MDGLKEGWIDGWNEGRIELEVRDDGHGRE